MSHKTKSWKCWAAGLFVLAGLGTFLVIHSGSPRLPDLPESCKPPIQGDPTELISFQPPDIDAKWRQAFGDECREVKRTIKMDLHANGWGVAADEFELDADGRIKLMPFSAFIANPRNGQESAFPDITTVRCREAYLTLDQNITSVSELGDRKIIKIELRGGPAAAVVITNNRGTADDADDVELVITTAPLFYEENRNLIWSDGLVRLTDYQSGKYPTQIRAKGMELHLGKENAPAPQGNAADQFTLFGLVSRVESVALLADVTMGIFRHLADPAPGENAKRLLRSKDKEDST